MILAQQGRPNKFMEKANEVGNSENAIEWKYRISRSADVLYVRECATGEIIARIPSESEPSDPAAAFDIVAACTPHFLGPIKSYHHDEDGLYVTCNMAVPSRPRL